MSASQVVIVDPKRILLLSLLNDLRAAAQSAYAAYADGQMDLAREHLMHAHEAMRQVGERWDR